MSTDLLEKPHKQAALTTTLVTLSAITALSPQVASAHEKTDITDIHTTKHIPDNTVHVSDIAWDSFDEMGASAEAPQDNVNAANDNGAGNSDLDESVDISTQTANRSGERRTENTELPANAYGSDIVSIAASLTGIPYVYGGSTPAGFDCSGLTQYVYAQVGKHIPRTSGEQGYGGTIIPASLAQPGDIVYSPGHVAIYAGNGMVIEATVPGDVSKIQPMHGYSHFVRY